ncbi:hypothetical protein [Ensifer adhaerens]|jgi:hypothetical protein|uniref:hypothetical protein n=1 Tax=Ensifer canadensis TaxID=555315 RepID=UPI00118460D3
MKKPRNIFGLQTRHSVKSVGGMIIERLPRAPKHKAAKVDAPKAQPVPLDPEEFAKRLLVEDAIILDYLAK